MDMKINYHCHSPSAASAMATLLVTASSATAGPAAAADISPIIDLKKAQSTFSCP
jgi:hypothetical protein